ncbi:MAG: class I SAM-dependent methyltransferase [Patescibacteria group bacterium]|nr:class I SAM-dependent methyltransferase [Patescibacteria group bacterium]
MQKEYAQKLIEKTKQDYKSLAKEFSATRAFSWQELEDLVKFVKPSQNILDAGCGNGRLYQLLKNKNIKYLGIDNSDALISEAKTKYQFGNFRQMDLLDLHFEGENFDIVFCIAALQHIPSKELRLQVLKDFYHILKPNSYLLMTNWNLWQGKYFWQTLKYSFSSVAGKHRELDIKDVYMPWKARFGVVDRYYHAFTKKELASLLEKTGFKVEEQYYVKKGERSNWRNGYNLITIAKK